MKLNSSVKILQLTRDLKKDLDDFVLPPEEGSPSTSQNVLSFAFVRDTRNYIEKIVHQINGSYENGWYDSCAVMIRRLIETLIIEVYEKYSINAKIKDTSGNYVTLKYLIDFFLAESHWTVSRNVKQSLPTMKNIGDLSAHNRRYIAHRSDIDNVKSNLRIIVQELISLSDLK